MPRFDYLCTDCKSIFEHLLPTGSPPPACLKCGGTNVQKLLVPPPVIFKGAGFFKTDSTKTATPVKGEPKKEEPKKTEPPPSMEKTDIKGKSHIPT